MNTYKVIFGGYVFILILWVIFSGNFLDESIEAFQIKNNRQPYVSPVLPTQSEPFIFCSSPDLPIPDYDPLGITDTLTITSTGTISDLNVSLVVTHTWVGDLSFTIHHLDTGTKVTIVDRPGAPATYFGCYGDNIAAILDDAALSPVEDECALTEPTINGTFIPNNPLSSFQGEDLSGIWALNAVDPLGADIGTLHEWCVLADLPLTPTPTPTDTPLPPTMSNTPSPTHSPTPTPSSSPTSTVSPPKYFIFLPGVYRFTGPPD